MNIIHGYKFMYLLVRIRTLDSFNPNIYV